MQTQWHASDRALHYPIGDEERGRTACTPAPRHECETRPRTHERFRCHGVCSRQIKLGPARSRQRNARTCAHSNAGHHGENGTHAFRRVPGVGRDLNLRCDSPQSAATPRMQEWRWTRCMQTLAWKSSRSREEQRGLCNAAHGGTAARKLPTAAGWARWHLASVTPVRHRQHTCAGLGCLCWEQACGLPAQGPHSGHVTATKKSRVLGLGCRV